MSEDFAILLVHEGDSPRSQWELRQNSIIIGRGEDCDVIINDRQVSRQHAKLIREDDQYKLVDLNSKNGTFLNGVQVKLKSKVLSDGDQIGIALSTRLIFVGAGATAPLVMEDKTTPKIEIDAAAKRVWIVGQELDPPLSLAQYKLLELLFSRRGGVVSRDEIVATVWSGEDGEGVSEQAIDALARRLRERIAEIDDQNQYIITVRGHGFRLENFVLD
jgi:pSer/pThr/pTyr-binding forkhead associated (FHA) protein